MTELFNRICRAFGIYPHRDQYGQLIVMTPYGPAVEITIPKDPTHNEDTT